MIIRERPLSPVERMCATPAPTQQSETVATPATGLTFDERTHTYRWDGEWMFSVSKVLRDSGLAPDFAGIDPVVLEKARNRGIAVHALTEAIDGGEYPEIPTELAGYVEGYRLFKRESGFELIAAELMVGHKKYGFAGRLDRLGWIGDQRTIADLKCVAMVAHQSTSLQLGAYAGGYEYLHPTQSVQQLMAVQLRPNGTYTIHLYSPSECWRVFLAALEVAKWRRAHNK